MICTSIQGKTLEEILAILESGEVEMAEIRLDLCDLDEEEIEVLFTESDVPLVATCRIASLAQRVEAEADLLEDAGKVLSDQGLYPTPPRPGRNPAEELAENMLLKAIEAGAKYVDLEMEAPPMMGRKIRQACQQYGSVFIRSFHDFAGTPPEDTLYSLLEKGRRFGGEVVKIVTTAASRADVDRVMALYREAEPGTLVAFCMGPKGRESRLEALKQGAPFTYACLTPEEATAPGQWTAAEMDEAVYGGFRFVGTDDPLEMPASKSFAQRAIVAAALAQGTSHLSGYSPCGDNESALAAARKLGAKVTVHGSELEIVGIGAFENCLTIGEMPVGESGFLARMLIPVLSVVADGPVRVTGEKTLLGRPLAGAHDIMASFGVRLLPETVQPEARKTDCFIPLTVKGPLVPGRADVSGKGGSQLISGLLAALPLAQNRSTVYVHDPRSIPYMFITVDVLRKFGVEIGSEMAGDDDFLQTQDWTLCTGVTFKMRGNQHYRAADFRIEGDWSGAANFLVAGAIFGRSEHVPARGRHAFDRDDPRRPRSALRLRDRLEQLPGPVPDRGRAGRLLPGYEPHPRRGTPPPQGDGPGRRHRGHAHADGHSRRGRRGRDDHRRHEPPAASPYWKPAEGRPLYVPRRPSHGHGTEGRLPGRRRPRGH